MAEWEPAVVGAGGTCEDAAQCRAAGGHAFWYSGAKIGKPSFWRVAGAPRALSLLLFLNFGVAMD